MWYAARRPLKTDGLPECRIHWSEMLGKPAFFVVYAAGLALNITFTRAYATHAGPGMAAALDYCMRGVGVPMALLPLQLDQFLMAIRIEQTGAAVISNPERPAPDFRAWFTDALTEPRFREAAMRLRESHGRHDFGKAAIRTAARIAEVAQG